MLVLFRFRLLVDFGEGGWREVVIGGDSTDRLKVDWRMGAKEMWDALTN